MTEQEISNRMAQVRTLARQEPPPADALAQIAQLAEGVPAPYGDLIRSMAEAVTVGTPK